MSGWIQAAMQQNTIELKLMFFVPNAVTLNTFEILRKLLKYWFTLLHFASDDPVAG